MSDENEQPKKVGSLIDNEQKTFDVFQNFLFIIWSPNPLKDSVRCILNDGTIKLWLKRDKFIKIMTELLGPTTQELAYSLFRIRDSLRTYGGWYYYDRVQNDFREIGIRADPEHLNPMDLIKESRKSVMQAKLADHFKEINNEYQEKTNPLTTPPKVFNKFFNVIRHLTKKDDKKIF